MKFALLLIFGAQILGTFAITFISPADLKYPVIKRSYPNGVVIYYVYDVIDGKPYYRGLPASLNWNVNGVTTDYYIRGNPPELYLESKSGAKLPLGYSIIDGKQTYWTYIDGTYVQLHPVGAILNSLPPLKGINWIPASKLPYPIVRRAYPNNRVVYWTVSNGKYVPMKTSLILDLNDGTSGVYTLGGNPPGLYMSNSKGVKYPIFYALNAQKQVLYYSYIEDEYFNLQLA